MPMMMTISRNKMSSSLSAAMTTMCQMCSLLWSSRSLSMLSVRLSEFLESSSSPLSGTVESACDSSTPDSSTKLCSCTQRQQFNESRQCLLALCQLSSQYLEEFGCSVRVRKSALMALMRVSELWHEEINNSNKNQLDASEVYLCKTCRDVTTQGKKTETRILESTNL